MQRTLGYLVVTFLFATVWVTAQAVLHRFEPGTVIMAEEVNENFAALAAEVGEKQARIVGECPAGSSIRVVNADGTTECETDDVGGAPSEGDITAVTAGVGLTGGALSGPATLALDTSYTDARYYPRASVDDLLAANAAAHGGLDPDKTAVVTEPNVVPAGLDGSSGLVAWCDVGQIAVGGGVYVSGSVDRRAIAFVSSRPSPSNRRVWEGEVQWTAPSTEDRTVYVYAVCVSP